jgi:hypothetical protein
MGSDPIFPLKMGSDPIFREPLFPCATESRWHKH